MTRTDFLPVFLNLRGRLALIVGGGEVALRKARLLHAAGAHLRVVAPAIREELVALASDCLREPATPAHLGRDVDLLVLATDAPDVQDVLQRAARERRIWCNRCDRPDASDFLTGAVCDRSPVVAGVISSGCPGLSRLLAARIGGVLTPAVVELARLLVGVRPLVKARIRVGAARAAFFRRWTTEEVVARLERDGSDAIRAAVVADLETAARVSTELRGAQPPDAHRR